MSSGARAAGDTAPNEEARRLFERGQRHYNVGEFDAAIDEFKRAYELSPAPGLLFNIAQAYRARRDRERALYYYATYLHEDPRAPERAYVEARMSELRGPGPEEDGKVPATGPAAGTRVERGPSPPAPVTSDEHPGRGLKIAGVITAATGVALVGTAVFFAARAGSASDEVSAAFATHQPWSPHLAEVYSDGQRNQTTAWVLGAVGVAALATGGALYYLGLRERPVSIAASASGAGASVSFTCAF
jgi:tetratricopeptide (TPR) repeat protein